MVIAGSFPWEDACQAPLAAAPPGELIFATVVFVPRSMARVDCYVDVSDREITLEEEHTWEGPMAEGNPAPNDMCGRLGKDLGDIASSSG